MPQIVDSQEEVQVYIEALDNSVKKWKIVDVETDEVVEGCESMSDREQYVWIMENQPKSEDGTGIAKYGLIPLDNDNVSMPWLD